MSESRYLQIACALAEHYKCQRGDDAKTLLATLDSDELRGVADALAFLCGMACRWAGYEPGKLALRLAERPGDE